MVGCLDSSVLEKFQDSDCWIIVSYCGCGDDACGELPDNRCKKMHMK
jgi:hypothetical protein